MTTKRRLVTATGGMAAVTVASRFSGLVRDNVIARLLGAGMVSDAFVTAFLPFYALAVASVFRLRRVPGYAPSFRAPLFPLVPLLFLSSVLYLLANAIVQPESRVSTLAVLGVVAAGIPIYYLTVGRPRQLLQ